MKFQNKYSSNECIPEFANRELGQALKVAKAVSFYIWNPEKSGLKDTTILKCTYPCKANTHGRKTRHIATPQMDPINLNFFT